MKTLEQLKDELCRDDPDLAQLIAEELERLTSSDL